MDERTKKLCFLNEQEADKLIDESESPQKDMKYLAIKIYDEIFVMNNNNELGKLIDNGIPYTVIGQVCTKECDTTCLCYRRGTCPCYTLMKSDGELIHVFVHSN